MKISALFLTLALMLMILPQAAITQTSKPEEVAQKSAEAWLALTDSGKYAESWDEAASIFKGAVTRQQWVDALDSARSPLGKVVSRTLKSATYTKSLPNAPAGEYVVILYNTSFENKKDSVETVTPMLDKDGKWRVSGYFIK
jgi:hypothetical protein